MIYRKTSLKTNSRIHHILHPRTPTDKLKILFNSLWIDIKKPKTPLKARKKAKTTSSHITPNFHEP